MPIKMRRVYLDAILERYSKSTKKGKTLILNEFCEICGYSRKYAIRVLRGHVNPRLNKPGPKPKYGATVAHHLRQLWLSMDQLCSKKMVEALPLWLPHYKDCDATTKALLLEISPSTIDRLLKPHRELVKKGLSTTRPSLIKNKIPIKLLDSEVTEPGHVEADTVAHCGTSIQGSYTNTLTVTDLFSGWTENRATWTKSASSVLLKIKEIERRVPFNLESFACDNGSEFITHELHDYFSGQVPKVELIRRRPYKKNDNAHVEQKNWTHVRQLVGYKRFDSPELTELLDEIYRVYWNPLNNYFIPNMKLKSKHREGGKVKKKYDTPKTPCQRLLEYEELPGFYKKQLKEEFSSRNPFHLKKELDRKLKIFFRLLDMHERQKQRSGSDS